MAKGKKPGTAVANIDQQLADETKALAERIQAPGGLAIKLGKDKTFRFPNGQVESGAMHVVILDFINRNLYYDTKFNEKNPVPPVCFAIGTTLKDMRPSANSPKKQSTDCGSCKRNEFPESGGGKECKNTRLLAVMAADAEGPDSPILVLQVSPTALRSFDGYVSTVAKMFNKPPIGVVTEISFDPTADYQSLRFSNPRPNGNVVYHLSRRDEARAILEAEPDLSRAATASAPARRGRTAR